MTSGSTYNRLDTPQSTRFARYLIGEMQAGRIRQGEKLPSIRAYAEQFKLGRQVVQSAFAILVKKHYVFNKNRSGYYVTPDFMGGFYYRIGYFFNRLNPYVDGNLPVLGKILSRYGWTVIPGNNFEEDLECVDWVRRKRDLDGVIVGGLVYEEMLAPLKQLKVPFLVMGNYDLPSDIPQTRLSHMGRLPETLIRFVRQKNIRNLVVFLGEKCHYNDILLGQSIKSDLLTSLPDLVVDIHYSDAMGVPGLEQVIRQRRPDGIYLLEGMCHHWRYFLSMHADCQKRPARPWVMVESPGDLSLLPKDFDMAVKIRRSSSPVFEEDTARDMLHLLGVSVPR